MPYVGSVSPIHTEPTGSLKERGGLNIPVAATSSALIEPPSVPLCILLLLPSIHVTYTTHCATWAIPLSDLRFPPEPRSAEIPIAIKDAISPIQANVGITSANC